MTGLKSISSTTRYRPARRIGRAGSSRLQVSLRQASSERGPVSRCADGGSGLGEGLRTERTDIDLGSRSLGQRFPQGRTCQSRQRVLPGNLYPTLYSVLLI